MISHLFLREGQRDFNRGKQREGKGIKNKREQKKGNVKAGGKRNKKGRGNWEQWEKETASVKDEAILEKFPQREVDLIHIND